MSKNTAIILLSGGLDSTTTLAIAQSQGFDCHALSFHYGQKQAAELAAAKRVAQRFNVPHHIMPLSVDMFHGSALTEEPIAVPDFDGGEGIPVTYVPARNTVFLSIALGFAETLEASAIFIGVNAVDYSGYPDCRPAYIEAFQKMANLATKAAVEGRICKIHTPLIHWSKSKIIQRGIELGIDYSMTVTCYAADLEGRACGRCDSCTYRRRGFEQAGVDDPTLYAL